MLGVDTSVMVRFLADDDDVQTPLAAQLLTNPVNQPVYVSFVVLSETYTVLTKVMKFPRSQVDAALQKLLSSSDFLVEQADLVSQALENSLGANCGFVDALVATVNGARGCEATATFDIRAQRLSSMIAVEDRI